MSDSTNDPTNETDQTAGTAAGGSDKKADMKAKFREALEKKTHRHHATAEGADHDTSEKSHGANGPTGPREFRRKSV